MSFAITNHLSLRPFTHEDAERLYAIHQGEGVKHWIPNESYADVEEARQAIAFYAGQVEKGELPFVLAIELRETGELIGDTGINEAEGHPREVEIGYCIDEKHQGKGYATQALRAMSDLAVQCFGTHVLYGRVMKGNAASVRVLEKNGYGFLREETDAEDDPYGNGMMVLVKKV